MQTQRPTIQERSTIIQITKIAPTRIINSKNIEYSLKQNSFDPTKSSPPNNFMIKLKERMSIYN